MTESSDGMVADKFKVKDRRLLIMLSTYNGEKYLKQQINSIMNQKTNAKITLSIRDDGSKDNTCLLIEELMKKYSGKIDFIRGENKGYNESFFQLLNSAVGYDYYAISDQDDVWIEDKLQTAIDFIEREDSEIPLLYASTSYLTKEDLKVYGTTRKKERELTLYNTIIQNICPGHTQVMNNALLERIKGNIDISRVYVYDSWINNIAMLYGKVIFDNEPHTYYRQHSQNQFGSGNGIIGQLLTTARRINTGDGFKYRHQIEYFFEINKEELMRQKFYKELKRFIDADNILERFSYLLTGKLYRQNKVETIFFYIAVVLGKY